MCENVLNVRSAVDPQFFYEFTMSEVGINIIITMRISIRIRNIIGLRYIHNMHNSIHIIAN